jgi:uncharacterized protein (DUF952 family)
VNVTYHGTPKAYWEALDARAPYLPADFERDGFIHCTDGREAASIILTLHYKEVPGDWVVLVIDKDRVTSPWRYDDPAEVFPHIYGPLNRDAIVAVHDIERAEDGTFLMPPA